MMAMIVAMMMMNSISGTKAIKNASHKKQSNEELLPIDWHPDHLMDWCMSEDEKKETKKLWK